MRSLRDTAAMIARASSRLVSHAMRAISKRAMLIACFTLLLSIMMLTQHSLLDLIGHTKKNFGEFKKSLLPAVRHRLKEIKERQEKRKGENTKKEKKDYVPPPIVVKEEPKEELAVKRPAKKPAPQPEQFKLPEIGEGYKLPPTELLDPPEGEQFKVDKETLHANSLILQKKLEDFGVVMRQAAAFA